MADVGMSQATLSAISNLTQSMAEHKHAAYGEALKSLMLAKEDVTLAVRACKEMREAELEDTDFSQLALDLEPRLKVMSGG